MKIEHLALNVDDPVAMADWYVAHCGMQVRLAVEGWPHTRFLADSAGAVMLEIYNNPADAVPDYAALPPLQLHVAFTSADPVADRDRLVAAGASLVEEVFPDGGHLVMLRDPWGLAIQLCRRGEPLL